MSEFTPEQLAEINEMIDTQLRAILDELFVTVAQRMASAMEPMLNRALAKGLEAEAKYDLLKQGLN